MVPFPIGLGYARKPLWCDKGMHPGITISSCVLTYQDCAQIFYQAMLDLSKAHMPTICKVLPLYKLIQECLNHAIDDLRIEPNPYLLQDAFQAGQDKLTKYLTKALISDYTILGAGTRMLVFLFIHAYRWSAQFFIPPSVCPISRIPHIGIPKSRNMCGPSSTNYMMNIQNLNLQRKLRLQSLQSLLMCTCHPYFQAICRPKQSTNKSQFRNLTAIIAAHIPA